MRYLIFVFILLCSTSSYAVYDNIEPLRNPSYSGYLGEIDSQATNVEVYRDPDVVTHAHECTHSVNSRIRLKFKSQNGYYIVKSKYNSFYLRTNPDFTLRDLANNIKNPGKIYQLYLVQQQAYWNETPLYVLDECVSYLNGTIVGIQTGNLRRAKDSFWRCEEMFGYVKIAQEMCRNINYAEQKDLDDFLLKLESRIKSIKENLDDK